MALTKTKIVPTDTVEHARQSFKEMLAKRCVLFVVLGNTPSAASLTSRADDAAGLPDELRWVVWAQQPADLMDEIKLLNESPPGFKDRIGAGKVAAFTTSFDHTILDAILIDEPISNVRVELAYEKAEAGG